jgi:hypothetical protein
MPHNSRKPSTTTRSSGQTIDGDCSGKTERARKLHVVLQGKAGVGKTVVALLLSQCIEETGEPVISIDADPVHASLSEFAATPPERLSMWAGSTLDTRALGRFTEKLLREDAHVVVDNGASGFVPIGRYLIESDVAVRINEAGRQVVVHVVVTGGPGMLDTMKGLAAVARDFPPHIKIAVWLNDYFGPIVNANGKPFEELPAYTDNRERIFALVRLAMPSEQATADLQAMFARRLTFARALAPDKANILRVQKSRLFRIRQALWPQIARVL